MSILKCMEFLNTIVSNFSLLNNNIIQGIIRNQFGFKSQLSKLFSIKNPITFAIGCFSYNGAQEGT